MMPSFQSLEQNGIQRERILHLNDKDIKNGEFVLYWMQASQRASFNHALEYAVARANSLGVPTVVFFGLTPRYPGANLRHYLFMLEGLREVADTLEHRGIRFVMQIVSPPQGVKALARRACLVVADRGYTTIQVAWRHQVAMDVACLCEQVESDVVVPVEWVTPKEEYAARTLRPKIHRELEKFLVPVRQVKADREPQGLSFSELSLANPANIAGRINCRQMPAPSNEFSGGYREAQKRLRLFLPEALEHYQENQSDPSLSGTSQLSPYLHFGQISALEVALAVQEVGGESAEAFLEQLIVRRELAINFVYYNESYSTYDCLPNWAQATLAKHRKDKREFLYTRRILENAKTHDPYWNAAQRQMTRTGHMHNYMRMYWGKKILEWSKTPEEAFAVCLEMNDRYELDGRDPNGYAGVAWCFGKHDRPWKERKIFGTIRYMNAEGLKRKFDIEAYARRFSR